MISLFAYYSFVPIVLILIRYKISHPTIISWLFETVSFTCVFVFIFIAFRWDIANYYLRYVYCLLFLASTFYSFRKIKYEDVPSFYLNMIQFILHLMVTAFMVGLLLVLTRNNPPDREAINLKSPFGEGMFMVVQGGNSRLLNHHYKIRSQSYALDIVKINTFGFRTSKFFGEKLLKDYEIFGEPVYSPCDGEVLLVENLVDDSMKLDSKIGIAGNHVLLNCNGVEVLMAHFQKSSIKILPGNIVNQGDFIGNVGNSGNSSEPHLHIHAENLTSNPEILDGKSIPIKINGKFLSRNDLLGH